MIICGIDASSSCTGLSIFDNQELIYYTKIRPKKDLGFRNNACQIADAIIPILKQYNPSTIYMEDIPKYVKQGSHGNNILGTLTTLGAIQGILYREISYMNGFEIVYVDVDAWRQELGFLLGKERKREQMKMKAVKFANETFGLELWFEEGSKSKKCDDDVAESVCIAWSQIQKNNKKQFGRK